MNDPPITPAPERDYERQLREMNEALLISSVRQHELTEQAEQAAAALRESEARWRLTIQHIRDYAIFLLDSQGNVASWNEGGESMLGYQSEEIIGQHFSRFFTAEDMQANKPERELQQAATEGRAEDDDWMVCKDGSQIWVNGVTTLRQDEIGRAGGFIKVARDVSERRYNEEELQKSRDELEERVRERTLELVKANVQLQAEIKERRRVEDARGELLRRLITAQEDERRRISREMHDQFGQQLTALNLKLNLLKTNHRQQAELAAQLETLEAMGRRLDQDVDFLVWELRPAALDDLGLEAALNDYADNWSQHFDIPLDIHTGGFKHERLTPEIETTLYRIAQEALNNVAKHAAANRVSLILERRADAVSLIIEDDGRGFDVEQAFDANGKGLGLAGMRERAALVGGTAEIESTPGHATTIFVRIPVPALVGSQQRARGSRPEGEPNE